MEYVNSRILYCRVPPGQHSSGYPRSCDAFPCSGRFFLVGESLHSSLNPHNIPPYTPHTQYFRFVLKRQPHAPRGRGRGGAHARKSHRVNTSYSVMAGAKRYAGLSPARAVCHKDGDNCYDSHLPCVAPHTVFSRIHWTSRAAICCTFSRGGHLHVPRTAADFDSRAHAFVMPRDTHAYTASRTSVLHLRA